VGQVTTHHRRRPAVLTAAALAACSLVAAGCSASGNADGRTPLLPVLGASSTAAADDSQARSTGAGSAGQPGGTTSASQGSAGDAAQGPASLTGKVVVIDPGHDGGNETHATQIAQLVPMGFGQSKTCDTTGTNGDDGYPEHEFNFSVSLLVQQILQQHGVKVILTHSNDTSVGPCVNVRAAIGNDAHANAAVSIHGDGFDASGHGFQIIQAAKSVGGTANDARSNALSQALHGTFVSESGLTPSTYIGTDGYETRSDLAGLNLSTVPKVLVECGNMKNPGDIALMESSAGRAKMAQAIADGIIAFLAES
jgi:N-acetylmuramoyl-L-alanine amidase